MNGVRLRQGCALRCEAGCLIRHRRGVRQALKGLVDEATFYDKQWAATWEGQSRPSENQ